ncbi:hypothetical protein LTR08_001532 [Meristemomyces frigidus]|nr:hypothetical protein LTR08_001532 [Meristemomyces frigidus]
MFVGNPPYGYEHTDSSLDSGLAHLNLSSTPSSTPYDQYPVHGCAMREAFSTEPESMSPTQFTETKSTDTTPNLSQSKNGACGKNNEVDPFDLHTYPTLPELESDLESEGAAAISNADEAVTPSEKNTTPDHTVMRCPQCMTILKWLFVDETKGGVHYIHRCQSSCGCGGTTKKPVERYGPVNVSRGAW